jgi:hypothetical protein
VTAFAGPVVLERWEKAMSDPIKLTDFTDGGG